MMRRGDGGDGGVAVTAKVGDPTTATTEVVNVDAGAVTVMVSVPLMLNVVKAGSVMVTMVPDVRTTLEAFSPP